MKIIPSDEKLQSVLALDEDFRDLIAENEDNAWRLYCEKNGLDPAAIDSEDIVDPKDYPF